MENLITMDMIDDWAGAAMQGLITSRDRKEDVDGEGIADAAYEIASEMARARGEFIEAHGDELAGSEGAVDDEAH